MQESFFDDIVYWIPEEDCGCCMWRCPVCNKRLIGQPLGWYQFNYYRFCPYCGQRLHVRRKHVSDIDAMPGD